MDDEESTVIALLHDVIEDTDTTFDDLKEAGFSELVISALLLLTHKKGVDYYDYVKEIGKDYCKRKCSCDRKRRIKKKAQIYTLKGAFLISDGFWLEGLSLVRLWTKG